VTHLLFPKGLFISFEGIDGCGKSTQLALFSEELKKEGLDIIVTREPGGTRLSERIRSVILKGASAVDRRAELLLYLAARAQNVSEIILPALLSGKIVLCDRFSDSTLAYQGGGRGLPYSDIKPLDEFACSGLKPDITFLFDLPGTTAAKRMAGSGRRKDRMEKEGRLFMEKVRKAYLKLAQASPERFAVIDARPGIDKVAREVLKAWDLKSRPLQKAGLT
jgi:dTMP kinase